MLCRRETGSELRWPPQDHQNGWTQHRIWQLKCTMCTYPHYCIHHIVFKLIWDKHRQMGYEAKAACPLCGKADTDALTNPSEETLVSYRKSVKGLSKTLAEAVSELWKEQTEAIKKQLVLEQMKTIEERVHFQGSRHPLPVN